MSGLLTRTTVALRLAVIELKEVRVRHIPVADRANFDAVMAVIENRLHDAEVVLAAAAARTAAYEAAQAAGIAAEAEAAQAAGEDSAQA